MKLSDIISPEKFRLLADYIDLLDRKLWPKNVGTEVQNDLRKFADELEKMEGGFDVGEALRIATGGEVDWKVLEPPPITDLLQAAVNHESAPKEFNFYIEGDLNQMSIQKKVLVSNGFVVKTK